MQISIPVNHPYQNPIIKINENKLVTFLNYINNIVNKEPLRTFYCSSSKPAKLKDCILKQSIFNYRSFIHAFNNIEIFLPILFNPNFVLFIHCNHSKNKLSINYVCSYNSEIKLILNYSKIESRCIPTISQYYQKIKKSFDDVTINRKIITLEMFEKTTQNNTTI